jgi:hypothetical protein
VLVFVNRCPHFGITVHGAARAVRAHVVVSVRRSSVIHEPLKDAAASTSGPTAPARFDLGYFGVDPLNPMEAGHARAVVSVINEVIPTQFH